ncbi:MAG: homoserine dehydrogenase [Acidimicrobiia bacterium]|nr:homoserine dehydrogenase [Acidimicrobiia bacterium]
MNKIGIGILGAGVVGGSLIKRLIDDREVITTKTGLSLEVVKVAVRSMDKERSFSLPPAMLTADPMEVVNHPDVELVVEIMGGREPAGELVMAALRAGKPVVTANKELIATSGASLIAAAAEAGVQLLFEAAVGGGIPIVRPVSETLAGEPINRIVGIVNGTTNYILTRMSEHGATYDEALKEAQALGYAESDPTADVSGADAAAKAAILASLGFGTWVGLDQVHHEGIEAIDVADIRLVQERGYVVKLLAFAERLPGGLSVRVHPALVRSNHPLAAIRGATNAVLIEGSSVGELLFSGPGAGGGPTATAVLGDVIDAARTLGSGAESAPPIQLGKGSVVPFGDVETSWYIRTEVNDSPGVLARIAQLFGDNDVSIRSVWQEGRGERATLILITHPTDESSQRTAVAGLSELDVVTEVGAAIRVAFDE